MNLLRCSLLAAALALPLGCGSSDAHPPEYSAPGIDNPRSCSELRNGGVDGNQLVVEGQPANCPASGLSCPLQGAGAFDAVCNGNDVPVAVCQGSQWTLTCVPEPDAGAVDAATDSASGD